MIAVMARIIALTPVARTAVQVEILRVTIVCGCAVALILAKAPLPF
ncbi:hypothetical protein WBP06_15355 [Novosphingobium sp. BL-8H]